MIRKHLVQSQKQISKGSRSFFDTVNRDWEKAWQNKVTPWETNQYTPPLKEFIVKGLQSNNVNRQGIHHKNHTNVYTIFFVEDQC